MKRPIILYLLFSLFVSSLIGVLLQAQSPDYLPLSIGNEWNFICTDAWQGIKYHIEITDTVTIKDNLYYAFKVNAQERKYLLRNDGSECIFTYDSLGDRKLYDFTLDDGAQYQFIDNIISGKVDTFSVTVQTEDISVPAGTFTGKSFFFDIPLMCDEEYSKCFAKGVGFIFKRQYGTSEATASLTYAIIDGEVIGNVDIIDHNNHAIHKQISPGMRNQIRKIVLLKNDDQYYSKYVDYYNFDLLGRKIVQQPSKAHRSSAIVICVPRK
ncbi:hypothetical protein ACFL5S_01855 [Fibrobacterota bacterium]